MAISNGHSRSARKIVGYDYDSQIMHDSTKINNSWTALNLNISDGDLQHKFTILSARPIYYSQTDWRPELVKLKRVLNILKESNLDTPEISIFHLGSRKIYPDERKPFPYPVNGGVKREIDIPILLSISKLFFDRKMAAEEKSIISIRMKEVLETPNPRALDEISYVREIFYDVEINVGDFDARGLLDVCRY